MAKKTYRAVGGDVFAGLFSIGVRDAGYRILGHIEHSDYGTATAKLNFKDILVQNGKENWDHSAFGKNVDFFYTNPPCAPWSGWNRNSGSWKRDPRIKWVSDLTDVGTKMRPKAFAWESVVGAWSKGRVFTIKQARKWADAGYSVTVLLQNNMYLGSSQNRKRMMFFAHRYPLVWPAFYEPQPLGYFLEHLEVPEEEKIWLNPWYKKLWEIAGECGGSFRRAWMAISEKEKKGNPIPSYMGVRLNREKISNIVTSHRSHPDEPRELGLTELLALNGVPLNYKFATPNFVATSLELQRAVQPPVGKWVATAVKNGLKERPLRRQEYRVIDLRKPDSPTSDKIDLDLIA